MRLAHRACHRFFDCLINLRKASLRLRRVDTSLYVFTWGWDFIPVTLLARDRDLVMSNIMVITNDPKSRVRRWFMTDFLLVPSVKAG